MEKESCHIVVSLSVTVNDDAHCNEQISQCHNRRKQNVSGNVFLIMCSCLQSVKQLSHFCVCMYAYVNFQPLFWCQPVLSSIPEIEKEMLAPDSQSALFLGRT